MLCELLLGLTTPLVERYEIVKDVRGLGLSAEEIEVSDTSALVGRALEDLSGYGHDVFVIGVRREQQFRTWHDVDGPIESGDVLIVLGPSAKVHALAAL